MSFVATILLGGETATDVAVPPEMVQSFDAEPTVRAAFDALSYRHQRHQVLAVEGATAPATRQRRITTTLATLSGGVS